MRRWRCANVGALIIGIGFWGPLYYRNPLHYCFLGSLLIPMLAEHLRHGPLVDALAGPLFRLALAGLVGRQEILVHKLRDQEASCAGQQEEPATVMNGTRLKLQR